MRYIIKHKGFNRQQRRHDSSVRMFIDEGIKTGHPIPKNIPYLKR